MRSTEHLSQSMRAHSLDLALRTPGIRDGAEVLKVARAYMEHIAGKPIADQATQSRPSPGAAHPGYSAMQPHQQRVVDEHTDLVKKADALATFIATKNTAGSVFAALPEAEQMRLYRQLETMRTYSEILSARIVAFPPA